MWIERDGLYVNGERRIEYFGRLIHPPGDAMSDARQMIEVGRRLGHGSMFPWQAQRSVEETWSGIGRARRTEARELPNLESLRSEPGRLWPTPGGRETRWRYNATYDSAADKSRGPFDFHGHADHRAWIWLRPHEAPAESPNREFPFWFTSGRVVEHWGSGSMTRRIPTLHRAVPHSYVEVNRDDARSLGIRDGDTVRLTSRRGTLELEARIDYRSQPPRGLLFAPCFDEEALVNLLTLDTCCPASGQPDSGSCAVRLERVGRPS
jgi:nitrate reductase NapA